MAVPVITTVARTQVLCEQPRVAVTVAALELELADALTRVASPLLAAGLVSDSATGRASQGRTCATCWLPHDSSPTARAVVGAMSAVAGIDARLGEQLHVIRYTVGGEYRPHFDAYRLETETGRRCTRKRGQRTHTALLYLNSDVVGGATVFPELGFQVPPVAGSVLTFENCLRGSTERDPRSLHGGAPVIVGEKWIATLWFRQRPTSPTADVTRFS